MNERITLP